MPGVPAQAPAGNPQVYEHFPEFDRIDPQAVQIVRDRWGIPYIMGQTDADVAYGLAWANAEDDFVTLQHALLAIRGRLAEVKGKEGAILDYLGHLIHARAFAESGYFEQYPPSFRRFIEAHVQGFNDYAEAHPEEHLRPRLFPITPIDLAAAYLFYTTAVSIISDPLQRIVEGKIEIPRPAGSNAFALAPHRTVDGSVYLAINSHQPLEGMFAWYEAHLYSEEGLNIHGGTFPGGLSIFLGVNQDLAWAHTHNYLDVFDVYRLEMHPNIRNLYRFDGKWLRLESEKITLRVKVGPVRLPIRREILWSVHGPVLRGKTGVYAIRGGMYDDLRPAMQWYEMNRARDLKTFRKWLKMNAIPCFNTVYGDRKGNIYWASTGVAPLRPAGYDWKLPVRGDTSATMTRGLHPFEDFPEMRNPACGWFISTNQAFTTTPCPAAALRYMDYDTTLGYRRNDNNRSRRFIEWMETQDQVDFEGFKAIKFDHRLPDSSLFLASIDGFIHIPPERVPRIADEVRRIQHWFDTRRSFAIDDRDAALFALTIAYVFERSDNKENFFYSRLDIPQEMWLAGVAFAARHLKRHFGSTDIPYGEMQRHIRGGVDMPIDGFGETLRMVYPLPHKKGRYRSFVGDGFMLMVSMSEERLHVEATAPYGQVNRPGHPHYTDQMKPFLNRELRTVPMTRDAIMESAVEVYHPGSRRPETPGETADGQD